MWGCLDKRFDPRSGLSRYVVLVEGVAGHIARDGCCGSTGFYSVKQNTGHIVAELEIPATGRYNFQFRYRVGSKGQDDEAIRIRIGDKVFDFEDRDLRNTDRWERSHLVRRQRVSREPADRSSRSLRGAASPLLQEAPRFRRQRGRVAHSA